MSRATLKERLLKWLRNHPGFIPSGELQRIVAQSTKYSPQNVGHRLRELENEGLIEVKYERGHAHYRAVLRETFEQAMARQLAWFESLPLVVPEPVA
jgi:DNA-binding transcriptional ArsR family regulator